MMIHSSEWSKWQAQVISSVCCVKNDHITKPQIRENSSSISPKNASKCARIINFTCKEKFWSGLDFFFASKVDNAGTLRTIFWADGKTIFSYLSFCDVIVFDTTYRTNHLNLPFAPFTGVNHHRQSILFGCALFADKQRDTFV